MKDRFIIFIFVVIACIALAISVPALKLHPVSIPVSSSSVGASNPPKGIPITVTELTSETPLADLINDTSSAEQETCCTSDELANRIAPLDSSVALRTNPDQPELEATWFTQSNDGPFYMYFTATPPGTPCQIGADYASCPNATLKVFNAQANSVDTIAANDFMKATEPSIYWELMLYLKKDNAVLVMGRGENAGKFILYNPTKKHAFKSMNTSSSYALLSGDSLAVFDSTTNKLSVEDLVSHAFDQCTITDPDYQKLFVNNFKTVGHALISADGKRFAIFDDKSLVWMNVSNWGSGASANCMDEAKINQSIKFISQSSTTSIANEDVSIQTDAVGNAINAYAVASNQQKSLIKSYQLLTGDYGPTTGVTIFRDENESNLFYLLVSDDYTQNDPVLRQIVGVAIDK